MLSSLVKFSADTDGQTDRRTSVNQYAPDPIDGGRGIKIILLYTGKFIYFNALLMYPESYFLCLLYHVTHHVT